ncbi:MAG TPA: toll/interleukin-1 receptor domain-containing protein [Longimicrobium sp.]|nr:toll/interleukin-1 receptor domain-containing protein [Longimicrobium sp.]
MILSDREISNAEISNLLPSAKFEWGLSIRAPYPPPRRSPGRPQIEASIYAEGAAVQSYALPSPTAVAGEHGASTPLTQLGPGVWAAAFILRVPAEHLDRVSLVARIVCANLVLAEATTSLPTSPMGASIAGRTLGPAFQRVFVSYARSELWVVELVNSVIESLQLADLRWDLKVLASGDNWEDRMKDEIFAADSFQLFWSIAAKRSREVRKEWMLALQRRRDGFVRPVYWEEPLVPPPRELKHLHFARILVPPSGGATG